MNKLLMFIFSLVLLACASKPPNDLEKPPMMSDSDPGLLVASAPPKHVPVAIAVSELSVSIIAPGYTYNILYKSFLFPSEKLNQSLTTFIYLPRKPVTEVELKQYNTICKVWMSGLSDKEDLVSHYDSKTENLVPFYWPIKTKLSKVTCDTIIENYDYGRMNILMQRNKLDANKIQFVSLYQKFNVVMNLTTITEDKDIVNSFMAWKTHMTKAPQKSEKLDAITLTQSLKKVLGVLGGLVISNLKG